MCFEKTFKNVNEAPERQEDSSTEDEDEHSLVEDVKRVGKPTLMRVKTNGVDVSWQPDTGVTKDIWDGQQL